MISSYTFEYDDVGNIVSEASPYLAPSVSPLKIPNIDMTYTEDNRLATFNGQAVQYDADGNMITGPLNGQMSSYTYDSRNRLVTAGNLTYEYDAENNRIGVTENINGSLVKTEYVVNPQAALSQVLMKTVGNEQTYYVYGLGLIGQEVAGEYSTYHFDLRGSTVAITNANGKVTDRYQYFAYGEILSSSGNTDTPFLYDGRDGVMTDTNGLYYMRARYYNPEIRRFVSQDILLGVVIDGQSLNRYAYVQGNPVGFVDPSGYVSKEVASQIIKDNAYYIKKAGEIYGVNPAIIAGCIYTEQITNVDWIDTLTDRSLYFLDTSIGIGQVKVSTARMLEDIGYVSVTRPYKIYANRITISREEAIADKLMDNEKNIFYVAAYLKYWQDKWADVYPEIAGRSAILGTLYNLGDRANAPNPNPNSNPFGDIVKKNYHCMQELLGLDKNYERCK